MKHITALVSGKGGVGKTLLTAAFGVAEARKGKRVLLLDLDMGMGNLDLALGLSPKYSMLGLVMGKCREKDAILHIQGGPDFLAAHFKRDWREIKKADVGRVLEDFADDYDLILLDCPAGRGKGTEFAKVAADSFLLIAGPSKASAINAKRTAEWLGNADIHAVYNDFCSNGAFSFSEAASVLKQIPIGGLIPHSDFVNRLLQEGRMAEYEEDSVFGKAVDASLRVIDGETEFSKDAALTFLRDETTGNIRPSSSVSMHPASRLHRARLSSRYGRRGIY